MAKVIYIVMALALGALVAGFFVDTSNAPLIGSIALSGAVMLLILFGWSRRIRRGMDLLDEDEGVDMAEIDADDVLQPVLVPDDDASVDLVEVDADDADFRPSRKPIASEKTAAIPAVKPKPRKPAAGAKKKAPAKKPPAKSPAKKKPAARKARSEDATPSTRVLVIPGRSRFHKAGCRFAKGDDLREVSETTARRRGYEPCNVCGATNAS